MSEIIKAIEYLKYAEKTYLNPKVKTLFHNHEILDTFGNKRCSAAIEALSKRVDRIIIRTTELSGDSDLNNSWYIYSLPAGKRKAELIARSLPGVRSADMFSALVKATPDKLVTFTV